MVRYLLQEIAGIVMPQSNVTQKSSHLKTMSWKVPCGVCKFIFVFYCCALLNENEQTFIGNFEIENVIPFVKWQVMWNIFQCNLWLQKPKRMTSLNQNERYQWHRIIFQRSGRVVWRSQFCIHRLANIVTITSSNIPIWNINEQYWALEIIGGSLSYLIGLKPIAKNLGILATHRVPTDQGNQGIFRENFEDFFQSGKSVKNKGFFKIREPFLKPFSNFSNPKIWGKCFLRLLNLRSCQEIALNEAIFA